MFTTPPIVFDLSITTDDASAVAESIGPDGGQLSAQAADGTAYTLEIPSGALLFAENISMTPIVEAAGLPGDTPPAHTAGVQLEPDGLELFLPATLRITPPSPLPEAGVGTFTEVTIAYGPGDRLARYIVELPHGAYLVAQTYLGPDFQSARTVLDDMMRTIQIAP